MSVYENMAFGLSGMSKEEVSKRIHDAAKKLQIEEYLDRKPTALSGGQCQRVALGRAVVRNSSLFLLDEPLSNLDAKLRVQMRAELVRLHDSLGNTMIYVTHDQTEAMTMADRIVIMRDGVVQQIGTPQEVYEAPSNVFVATFMGSPSMNIVDAVYNKGQIIFQNGDKINLSPEMKQKHDDSCARRLKELSEKIKETREKIESKDESPVDFKAMLAELEEERGNVEKTLKEGVHEVYFGIRPEDFSLEEENRFQVKMGVKEMMGAESIIHFSFGEEEMSARLERELADKAFSASSISMPSSKIHLFERDSQKLIF
jgi:multiple sugar transport system ATP-binding protein